MRNLGLDILRILAVLLVIGAHLQMPDDPSWFLSVWDRGGWMGVDLFFVLSGYLVSGLLFREYLKHQSLQVGRFLIRRGFKIYPAFWAFMAFTVFIRWRSDSQSVPVEKLIAELLFVQNYFPGLYNHTWTLAVEEHFYFGIALLLGVVLWWRRGENPFKVIPAVFVAVALLCLGFRLHAWWAHGGDDLGVLFPTHMRADSLFFGVLLSYLTHFSDFEERVERIPAWVLTLVGCALISPAFIWDSTRSPALNTLGVIPVFLGCGCMLMAGIRLRSSRNPLLILLGALGATSYSIYLWHTLANVWFYPVFRKAVGLEHSYPLYMACYIGGSLLIGYLMSRIIEWPVLRLRDRWCPSRSKALRREDQPNTPDHHTPAPMPAPGSPSAD